MFVRNATGLVRELTPFDAFNLTFAAILVPLGISEGLNFGSAAFPGANIALAYVLGAILLLGFAGVYIDFTLAMPRSGGDYVWVSRSLSPFLGFVVNATLTFVFIGWVAFNFTTMMTLFMSSAAYVFGWPEAVVSWFAVPINQFIVATVLTVLFTLLMLQGTRFAARFMRVMFVVVWAGVALWYIGLIITPNAVFQANFTAVTGFDPATIINIAKAAGFETPTSMNMGMTLAAMMWAFLGLTGFEWTGYFAGEVKNIRRTAVTSVLASLIGGAALYAIGALLVYRMAGYDLFSSLSYVGLNAPDKLPAGVPFVLPALTRFMALPVALKDYIVIAFLLAVIWWTPAGFMLGTRNLFAWSFDRMAPEWVADVHPTLHTPVKATIIVGIGVELINSLTIFGGLKALIMNIFVVMALAFVLVGVAAIAFPYRRKDLFQNAPDIVQKKVFGVPLMVIAGVVMTLSWLFVLVGAFTAEFGLTLTPAAIAGTLAIPVVSVIWYFAAVAIRRHQGLDMSKVFSEIPPE